MSYISEIIKFSDLGYGLEGLRFESRHGQGIFVFSITFRRALGPTQPPFQCALDVIPEVKRLERDFDHLPHSSAKVKNEWS